jgi:hypothetical protein
MLEAFRAFKLKRGGFRDIERLIRKLCYQTGWQTNSDVVPDLFPWRCDDDSIPLPFWHKPFADRGPMILTSSWSEGPGLRRTT